MQKDGVSGVVCLRLVPQMSSLLTLKPLTLSVALCEDMNGVSCQNWPNADMPGSGPLPAYRMVGDFLLTYSGSQAVR